MSPSGCVKLVSFLDKLCLVDRVSFRFGSDMNVKDSLKLWQQEYKRHIKVPRHAITLDEVRTISRSPPANADPWHWKAYFGISWAFLLRHGEIDRLKPSDVRRRVVSKNGSRRIRWEIYIPDAKTQVTKGENQVAPQWEEDLPKEVVAILESFVNLPSFNKWLVPSSLVCKHLRAALKVEGDDRTVFHGLRHGRATFLRQDLGFSIQELKEAGRWKSDSSVAIYTHL